MAFGEPETALYWREADQTWSFRGSKSRNKVSVGEPAEGSLSNCNTGGCCWPDPLGNVHSPLYSKSTCAHRVGMDSVLCLCFYYYTPVKDGI
jgi:hypothetical protein